MTKTDYFYYNQRVELNRETIMMLNFVGPFFKNTLPEFTSLVVACMDEEARAEEAANEWKGLAKNMQEFMFKVARNNKIEMDKKFKDVEKKVEDLIQEHGQMV